VYFCATGRDWCISVQQDDIGVFLCNRTMLVYFCATGRDWCISVKQDEIGVFLCNTSYCRRRILQFFVYLFLMKYKEFLLPLGLAYFVFPYAI